MEGKENVFATLFGGAAAYFFTQALYHGYVKKEKDFNTANAMLLAFVNGVMAYIFYSAGKGEAKSGEYKGVDYSGLITPEAMLNQEIIRETCRCEPVCTLRCYAKGVIGSLNVEQIKKYCPQEYEKIKDYLKEGRHRVSRDVKLEEELIKKLKEKG